jgi:hypothetical protein
MAIERFFLKVFKEFGALISAIPEEKPSAFSKKKVDKKSLFSTMTNRDGFR